MDLFLIIAIILLAFSCEFLDTSLGGGYGTILTPVLLLFKLDVFYIVPSILMSEILTGFGGAVSHQYFGNTDFSSNDKINRRIFYLIGGLGVIASALSVIIALQLNKVIIKIYIGILVLILGLLMFRAKNYIFSWKKLGAIGLLSAFNKSISGGGFGPLVTAGQVVSGRSVKNSIGVALACETPVCIVGLVSYILFNGIFSLDLAIALIIGAVPATFIGALTTKRFGNEKTLKKLVGILAIFLGTFTIMKTFI